MRLVDSNPHKETAADGTGQQLVRQAERTDILAIQCVQVPTVLAPDDIGPLHRTVAGASRKKPVRRNAERLGNLVDHFKRRVGRASFNGTEMADGNTCRPGEHLQAQPLCVAYLPDFRAERYQRFRKRGDVGSRSGLRVRHPVSLANRYESHKNSDTVQLLSKNYR